MSRKELVSKITEQVSLGADNWGVDLAVSGIMQSVDKYIKSQSPTTADASVLKEALERIESAEVAEDQEFTFDPGDFIFQLKGIARKALAQYSNQSPSSIEESGLKEGEDDPEEFIISEIFKQWAIDDWQDDKGQAERFAAYLDTHYRTIEK